MQKKVINFVLFGRSGSGKDTQAELLKQKFTNLFPVNTGDLFRELRKQDSDVAHRTNKVLDEGGLPIGDLAIALWMHEISFNLKEDQGFLAIGFPRRVVEVEALDGLLDYLERKENTKIILIDISRQEAFDRLTKRRICEKCGKLIPYVGDYKNREKCEECGGKLKTRFDDNPEAINGRMDYFEKDVVPVIEAYKKMNRLITINGEQSIEDVHKDIMKSL